jgi:hypothetical protein
MVLPRLRARYVRRGSQSSLAGQEESGPLLGPCEARVERMPRGCFGSVID